MQSSPRAAISGLVLGPVVVLSVVLGAAGSRTAQADTPEVYPVAKVKRGQKGYGMTTFQGTTPERFEFEVVGIAKNFLPTQDIILVKSDDPKLAVSGFWQGMSGSPLYIDGKVVCAFSYGFRFNKVPLGGCTPIESMIKEGGTPLRGSPDVTDAKGNKKKKAKKTKGKKTASYGMLPTQVATLDDWKRLTPSGDLDDAFNGMSAARQPWLLSTPRPDGLAASTGEDDQDEADETMTASVPLALAGFSSPAFDELEKLFGGYGVEPVRAGGTGGASADGPTSFTMGGSISVQLIRGDMSAAATGTVSWIDGKDVLAFGHPMFQTGETYAPVATAEVLGVVPSAQSAFVLAQPLNEAGALIQDRQSMIKADTSLRHPMIPVDIYISAGEGKDAEKAEFHVEVWNNKFFAGNLAGAATMNAVNVYLPDREDTTARIDSTLKVRGLAAFHFVDFLYANDGAGSVVGAARGLRAIVPLLLNPWAPLTIESVEVKVDLAFDANYGDIKELRMPAGELTAGKTYLIDVVLETHGKKDVIDQVPVEIPASLAGQIVTIEIAPGDAARLDVAPPVDLDSLVAAIRSLLPGNVYAASVYGADEGVAVGGIAVRDLPASAQDKLHPQTSSQRAESFRPISRTTSPAKRVVNGSASTTVRIANADH